MSPAPPTSHFPHQLCHSAPLMVPAQGSWRVGTYLPVSKVEELAGTVLAKRTAIGKVASEFFWHSAKIARLGP